MKSPLLKKELTAKSDWKLFLNAAPVMSAKIDPQQIDESGTADVVMPSPSKKVVELQKTQKCSTKERDTLIPKIMPQSDKAKNIAQYGLKCGPAEYPTFGDVVSDWSTVDGVMTVEKMKEIDEKEIRRRKIIVEQQQQKDAIAAVATPPTTMKKENKDEEKIQQKKSKEGKNENVKVEEKEGKKKKKASKEKEEKRFLKMKKNG
uniref:Uncharacterized protein n=1 Tax=Panagrolaimus superbus TaxID=310955 RepID=A0A914YXM3_9BILA